MYFRNSRFLRFHLKKNLHKRQCAKYTTRYMMSIIEAKTNGMLKNRHLEITFWKNIIEFEDCTFVLLKSVIHILLV